MTNQELSYYFVGGLQFMIFLVSAVWGALQRRKEKAHLRSLDQRISFLEVKSKRDSSKPSLTDSFQFLHGILSNQSVLLRKVCKKCEINPYLYEEECYSLKEANDE